MRQFLFPQIQGDRRWRNRKILTDPVEVNSLLKKQGFAGGRRCGKENWDLRLAQERNWLESASLFSVLPRFGRWFL